MTRRKGAEPHPADSGSGSPPPVPSGAPSLRGMQLQKLHESSAPLLLLPPPRPRTKGSQTARKIGRKKQQGGGGTKSLNQGGTLHGKET